MDGSTEPLPLQVDVQSVKQLIDQQADFLLLDCREQDEYAFAHIDGCTLLPLSEIQNRSNELAPHRDRHIVVYCHIGGRSMDVTQWLRQQGFARVQNMTGGIKAWAEQIDASMPRY